MKNLNSLIIFFLICFTSCNQAKAPHDEAGDLLISKFAEYSYQTRNFGLLGSGGRFLDDIKKFFFFFYTCKKVDVNQARKLLIETVEDLVNLINSEEYLQEYLHERPFTYKNIELYIAFLEAPPPPLTFVSSPNVAGATIDKGLVHYTGINPVTGKLELLHIEAYQKAKGILEHQKDVESLPPILQGAFSTF